MKQPVSTPRSSALLVFCLLLSCTLAEAATGSAITDDVVVDTRSYSVSFDLGAYGTRSGGGALSQTVLHGEAASAPTLAVAQGWVFGDWSADFNAVTADLTVVAQYESVQSGPPVLDLDSFYESNSGQAVTIDATPADGYPDFAYQWYFNGFAVPLHFGGTASSYQISGVSANNGTWRVVVTNSEGSAEASFEYRVFVDSDGDGLHDDDEVNIHGTNPNASDSDADGLSDADEITTHSTDPNLADSDSDGLSDGTEINTHSSDPLASDSSGDGLSDGYVVSVGFDPNTNYTGILEGSEGMTQDLRIGAEIASVTNGAATLQIVLEESADLSNWSHRETVDLVVPLQAGETTKFFRYAMQGAPSDDGLSPAVPDGFALIPGGSFQMGDALDGMSDAPVVTVAVSAFYMGQYEVTKAEWDEVRTWGLSNGYTDLAAGDGKAANHPVHSINWYAMVKWCNARSEMEGRTPCYSVSGSTYRTGSSDAVVCDWTATGYRLPTEAEWEKAARGGATGQRFPWGATISHANANYSESTYYSYDVGDGSGYHPDYDSGDTPYTSAVGSFAANGYGLYDMAGNVFEWCWDWKSSSYSDGAADPRGASSGSYRVRRGGSWYGNAYNCRVANRNNNNPSYSLYYNGFRVALSSVPQ